MKRILMGIAPLLLILGLAACGKPTVANNKMVSMDYKGTLTDGTIFSESPAGKPLEFLEGAGTLLPVLEKGMLSMKVGDKTFGFTNPGWVDESFYTGDLVQSWEWTDPLTLTFHVRHGIMYSGISVNPNVMKPREFVADTKP